MLLSSLIGKRLFSNTTQRGVCTGIGISLKTHTVKYLLCVHETEYTRPRCDFALQQKHHNGKQTGSAD